MDKFQLSVTVLLTGLVVVFVLLLVLIIAIKIYSTIVSKAQSKRENKKKAAIDALNKSKEPDLTVIENTSDAEADEGGISDEIIAVIAAAVSSMYPQSSYTVKTVKRAKNTRSAWSTAGLLESTRPF